MVEKIGVKWIIVLVLKILLFFWLRKRKENGLKKTPSYLRLHFCIYGGPVC